MMKRLLASAMLLLASALALAQQPTAVARIAADGIGTEFVFNNPAPQAYFCKIADATVRYSGGVERSANVYDVLLGPGAQNIVVKQSAAQIADLRKELSDGARAESTNGKVTLPIAGCELDWSGKVTAVVIDNRSSCGDARSIVKLYAMDLKNHTITVVSPPVPQATLPGVLIAHGLGLPVFYSIADTYPGQINAWKIDADAIAALKSMAMPAPPTGANETGKPEVSLAMAGAAMLDRATLLLAYAPGLLNTPSGPLARLYFDVVTLDGDGSPALVTRRSLDTAMISNPELFMARSLHKPDTVTLYVAGTEVARRQSLAAVLASEPTNTFGVPLAVSDAIPLALQIDASKSSNQWQFTAKMPQEVNFAAGGEAFLASGAMRDPGATQGLRIGNMVLVQTGKRGAQGLQAWSLAAQGKPVLSQSTAPDLCDARIIGVDSRDYASGEPDLDSQDAAGKTRMHLVVEQGDAQSLAVLLLKKPKLNLRDKQKNTALMIAMNKNRGDLFSRLLTAGADFNMQAPDPGGLLIDPLHAILLYACESCIEPLRKANIPLSTIIFSNGATKSTKLMFCMLSGQDMVISMRREAPPPDNPDASTKPVVDPLLEQKAQAVRRARMALLLNIDCNSP
ncbi:hypothetical protein IFT64_02275 [Oxalobacteraceae sp. CFBP 8753]|nr:hypothetical protein [Oxalobacteraceae sp. CFBP 8753]